MDGYKVSMMDGGKASLELIGAITWWKNSAEDFASEIKSLEKNGAVEIELYINSPGGSVFDANEIVNILNNSQCRKSVAKIGALCASAATIVALAFDRVVIAQNGMFMIHDPYMDVWDATEKKLRSALEMLSQLKVGMVQSYVGKSGKSQEEIIEMMDAETWMSSVKAVDNGFADAIDGVADEDEQTEMMAGIKSFKYKHLPLNYTTQIKKSDMKSVVIALGLPEGATEEEAMNAVAKLTGEVNALRSERAEALVDAAIEAKKIPAGNRDQWVKDAQENYPLAKRMFGSMQAVEKVSAKTVPVGKRLNPQNNAEEALASKDLTFDDLLKDEALLDEVRSKHPDAYASLYRKKYGVDCVIED